MRRPTYPAVNDAIALKLDEIDRAAGKPGAASDLAKAVKVSDNTVSEWRHRESSPAPRRWAAIEEALRLPTGSLSRAAGVDPSAALPPVHDLVRVLQEQVAGLNQRLAAVEEAVGVRLVDTSADDPVTLRAAKRRPKRRS